MKKGRIILFVLFFIVMLAMGTKWALHKLIYNFESIVETAFSVERNRRIVSKKPLDATARCNLAIAYYHLAKEKKDEDDIEEYKRLLLDAKSEFNKTIELDKSYAKAYFWLATIYFIEENDLIKTEQYIEKSLMYDKQDPQTVLLLAELHKKRGEIKEAIVWYKKAVWLFENTDYFEYESNRRYIEDNIINLGGDLTDLPEKEGKRKEIILPF